MPVLLTYVRDGQQQPGSEELMKKKKRVRLLFNHKG
jgi:hypothetical protein